MKTIVWLVFVLGAFSTAAKVILTKPGQTAVLECGVAAFRSSLVWNRESELILSVDGKTGFTRKGKSLTLARSRIRQETHLEISKVKAEDAGIFVCVADGKNHEHTLLVVSECSVVVEANAVSATPSTEPQRGSEVTLKCQVNGLKSESTVQWKRPGEEAASGKETVQLNSVAHSHAGVWSCLFSHDGMSYTEKLEIKVHEPPPETTTPPPSAATQNYNPSSTEVAAEMKLLGLSWWIWGLIILGCLVIVILIVLVIVLCKRNKRKKRKLEMMKNGRKPGKPKKYCQCDRPAVAAKPQQGRRREKPSALPLQPLLME